MKHAFRAGIRAVPRRLAARGDTQSALTAALEELAGGAVVVLDGELRVVVCTRGARALLGEVAPGTYAPEMFSRRRDGAGRISHALTSGQPVTAFTNRRPGAVAAPLRLLGVPVGKGGAPAGWALFLEERAPAEGEPELFHGLWSADPTMKQMFRIVEKVARTDSTVLVRGETGSGKELVATAIHALSSRASGPLRALNCAAVPGSLLESELFGHAKGAFTGAVRDTPGYFTLANRGTLFLDEVAELSLDLQAKLLRVLETHTVTPVGGREPIDVDVRVVAATHRALRKEVEAGRFRADLMYRLRVIPIFVPPLRARGDDVILLAERFIGEMNARSARRIGRISEGAKATLMRHDWPGNVRELRNVLEYAFAIGEGPVLTEAHLPPELVTRPPGSEGQSAPIPFGPAPRGEEPASPEASRILLAIDRSAGNRDEAARQLGISRITLWRRMKALGLVRPRRRRQ
jgi:transcriptional regulator with PAS, ATPase and Fis domain